MAFDVTGARPAEEVWPEAVIRLPRNLPDGRTYTAKGRLDDNRFVVVPGRGDSAEMPVVYDVRTGRVTDIITAPVDWVEQFSTVSVADRDIILAVDRLTSVGDHRGPMEVWVVPRAGGPATRRAVFEYGTVTAAFNVGDALFAVVKHLESHDVTTVYRLPTGGSPERVIRVEEDPKSLYGRWFETGSPAWRGAPETAPFTFLDVATGERRTTTRLDELTDIVCSPDVCAGFQGTDLVVYRSDGTGPTRITGLTPEARVVTPVIAATGRFIGFVDGAGSYLWDRRTNIVVTGLRFDLGQLHTLLYSEDGTYLFDLSRIP